MGVQGASSPHNGNFIFSVIFLTLIHVTVWTCKGVRGVMGGGYSFHPYV